jgi:hypothetical protein
MPPLHDDERVAEDESGEPFVHEVSDGGVPAQGAAGLEDGCLHQFGDLRLDRAAPVGDGVRHGHMSPSSSAAGSWNSKVE